MSEESFGLGGRALLVLFAGGALVLAVVGVVLYLALRGGKDEG